MSTPCELKSILVQARQIIADKGNWTQGAWGRKKDGRALRSVGVAGVWRGEAERHCAIGAVYRAAGPDPDGLRNRWSYIGELAVEELNRASYTLYGEAIVNVNDNTGHAAVLKCFDLAIDELDARCPDAPVFTMPLVADEIVEVVMGEQVPLQS